MGAGADAYVTKPAGPEELKVLIREGQRMVEMQMELIAARKALRAQVEILRNKIRQALARSGGCSRSGA